MKTRIFQPYLPSIQALLFVSLIISSNNLAYCDPTDEKQYPTSQPVSWEYLFTGIARGFSEAFGTNINCDTLAGCSLNLMSYYKSVDQEMCKKSTKSSGKLVSDPGYPIYPDDCTHPYYLQSDAYAYFIEDKYRCIYPKIVPPQEACQTVTPSAPPNAAPVHLSLKEVPSNLMTLLRFQKVWATKFLSDKIAADISWNNRSESSLINGVDAGMRSDGGFVDYDEFTVQTDIKEAEIRAKLPALQAAIESALSKSCDKYDGTYKKIKDYLEVNPYRGTHQSHSTTLHISYLCCFIPQ